MTCRLVSNTCLRFFFFFRVVHTAFTLISVWQCFKSPIAPPGEPARWRSSPLQHIDSCEKGKSIKYTGFERNNEHSNHWNARVTAPRPNSCNPSRAPPACAPPVNAPRTKATTLVLSGMSGRQLLLGSLSLLAHIFPLRNTQRFEHAGICPLSIQWPPPPDCRMYSTGLSTGCNGGRDASKSVVFCFCTSSICRPLSDQTALRTYQLAHGCSSVCRTLLSVISHLSLERISYSGLCCSVNIHSVWSTSWPPTPPLPPYSLWRSTWLHPQPRGVYTCIISSLGLLTLPLAGGQPLCSRGCPPCAVTQWIAISMP